MTYLNISYGLRPPMRFAYGVTTDLTEVHEVASFVHKKVSEFPSQVAYVSNSVWTVDLTTFRGAMQAHALTDWAMLPDRSSRVF